MVHIIAVLIYYWIDLKKLWFDQLDKIVVIAVVVISSSKSWIDKRRLLKNEEGFGRMS
jgi:hypothetical protein